MSETPAPAEEPASLVNARALDRLCDRFEAVWREGGRPSLEAFLAEAPAALRAAALRQLLLLDVEYRQRAGDAPAPDDYLPRFGDFSAVVHDAFHASLGSSGDRALTLLSAGGADGPVPAIPGYEILGELGRGGMGVVYQARQMKAGRVVALKTILSGSHAGAEQRARFRTEVEAVARLQHPNIVQVFEVGEHGGLPYFSLEFCPGGSLAKRLAAGPLPPRPAAALVEALARAMHAAHTKGVIHRDLKPANVLFAEDGTPKVSDFGLAKVLDEAGRTATGVLLGTPSYMVPEQARGRTQEVGRAADVYALGTILYECLAGRPPFKAATSLETVRQVCEQEPVSPRWLNRQVPRDLETICLKCLQKEPPKRYESAESLAADLARWRTGASIHAQPPTVVSGAARWVRRHPAAASSLAVGALLVVTVTLGSLWYSAQLTQASTQLTHALEGEQQERLRAKENEERARRSEGLADQWAYGSDVRLACQQCGRGDVYELSDLLDRHLPTEGAADRREFAWFYVRQFSRSAPPQPLQAHRLGVISIAFSADGRLAATAGWGFAVRTWEMPEGRCLQTFQHVEGANALYPDGRTLAVVPADQRRDVSLRDPATGEQRKLLQDAAPSEISRLLLSADGKTLAVVAGGSVRLWDAQSLQPLGQLSDAGDECVALSPDGRTLADVSRKDPCLVRLTDVSNGGLRRQARFGSDVISLTFSPKGGLLAVSQRDYGVTLIRTDGGRLVAWRSFGVYRDSVVAFSPDGRRLAIGVGDEVRLWDLYDGSFRRRLRWQAAGVSALAFSPDGQVLAVGTGDGQLHRVNPDSPPDHETLRADLRANGPLAVSQDGRTIALSNEDDTVKLVDAASGEVRLTLAGHGGRIADCAFSPDDRTLATAGVFDAEVRLWDTVTGKEKKRLRADASGIRSLAFSPCDGLLAAGDEGGTIWAWDATTGESRGKLAAPAMCIRQLAFSADGRVLAACSGSDVVSLWDIPLHGALSGAPRENVALPAGVNSIAFAPSGRTLAAGDLESQVHLLAIPERGLSQRIEPPMATGAHGLVTSVAFAPDGRSLLVTRTQVRAESWDWLSVWDVATAQIRTSWRHCDFNPDLHAAAWMPDGRLLVQSPAGDVQIHDLTTASVRMPHGQGLWPVVSLAFSPDGRSLYLGTSGSLGEIRSHHQSLPLSFISSSLSIQAEMNCKVDVADAVRVWDADRLTPGPRLPGEESMAPPGRIALSTDGRLLAAGGADGSIRIWDLAGRRLRTRLFISKQARDYAQMVETLFALSPGKPEYGQHSEDVASLAFSPDGRWLGAAGAKGSVLLWETDGWREHRPLASPQEGVAWVGFSPASVLAVACKGQVRLYDPRTREVGTTLGDAADPPILCGVFSPDGCLLAMGTAAQTVRVWDLRTADVRRTLTGHMNQVAAVAFSPDGKTLASGDWSGVVKLWSAASFQEVASLEVHSNKIRCLAFSPDRQSLAAGVEAEPGRGEVFLWRAPHQ